MGTTNPEDSPMGGSSMPRPRSGRAGLISQLRLGGRRLDYRQLGVLILAVFVATVVWSALTRANRQTARLGEWGLVLVATAPIEPGGPLGPDNTTVAKWPVGLIPPGALSELPGLVGARQSIGVGEPVTANRVAPPNGVMIGELSVVIPLYLPMPSLADGDPVRLYAITPIGGSTGTGIPSVAATVIGAGRVIKMADGSATVALPETVVPRVLEAMAVGSVELTGRAS